KLYVGNLSPTVDEYTLLRVFSRFGKITNLDYLFHKSGPLRGKPRGYAFVEYGDAGDATKALNATHHKLLRGRKIVVTHAQQAPMDAFGSTPQHKSRRIMADSGRPTTLSILKSASGGRKNETKDKIAMMEAKLHQMEQ
ncbi:RNA-binding domain-containing protein, partial [Fistulina hepatica ATCC 64428]